MSEETNASVAILKAWLEGYEPAPSLGGDTIVKTTSEIIEELEDMSDLDKGEVTMEMLSAGYRSGRTPGGRFGWLMRPLP